MSNNAIGEYPTNCDWVREKYMLSQNVSIYEIVNTLVNEIKKLEKIQTQEKKHVGRKRKTDV